MKHSPVRMLRFAMRDATWITTDRALAVSRVLLVFWVGLTSTIPWTVPTMHIAADFGAFWTAAKLAVEGRAADAYGQAAREALAALFGSGTYPPFFYPPTALLVWLPFAFLPFAPAAALWITTTVIAYVVAIRAVVRVRSLVPILAFPSVLICVLFGQNSLLSAALFGGAAATLSRYPVVCGVLIGLLGYKPQLAFLAPLSLALAGRWRAFAAATATAASIVGLSIVAFGADIWSAFVGALPDAKVWNAGGAPGFEKFASPYAAARLLGASEVTAWTIQGAAVVVAIATLVVVTLRRPGGVVEIVMLIVATGFCVPFLGQYDLAILAVPGAWVASEAGRTGWLPYERSVLAMLYLSPVFIVVLGTRGVPLAPVALMALAALVLRRIFNSPLLREMR